MAVKPTTDDHIKSLLKSKEVYPVTSPRGRVFIIHNDEFDEPVNPGQACLDYREGSESDLSKLKKIFVALDFDVQSHNNLSAKEIRGKISEETKHADHEKYGMFIMVIMSHGTEGVIYASDSWEVSINDITRRLSGKSFPAMAGKPKIVIVQACAGESEDITVRTVKADNPGSTVQVDNLTPTGQVKSSVADLATLQASCPGYKSYRDSRSGSFMIQSLISALRDFSCEEDFKDLVVRVRNSVLQLSEEKKDQTNFGAQTVHLSETLTKKLYFFPGITGLKQQPPTPVELNSCAKPEAENQQTTSSPDYKPQHRKQRPTEPFAGNQRLPRSPRSPPRVDPDPQRQPDYEWIAVALIIVIIAIVVAFICGIAVTTTIKTGFGNKKGDRHRHSKIRGSDSESYSLHANTKLTHVYTIATSNKHCYSVAFQPYGEGISHPTLAAMSQQTISTIGGGENYNSLNKTWNVNINCVRFFGRDILIQLENNMEDDIAEVVEYKLKINTQNDYTPKDHKIRVNFRSVSITHFTKIDDILVQTGGDSGEVYLFRYSTGERISTAMHRDLKHPLGICHDEQSKDTYITDNIGSAIFRLVMSGEKNIIKKLAGSVINPTGITMHDGKLLVLSNIKDDPKLHILTIRGEEVTVIGLSECKGAEVFDISVNSLEGKIAIANGERGYHIYEIT